MQAHTLPRAIAATAAIVAAGLVLLLARTSSDEPLLVALPSESSPPAQSDERRLAARLARVVAEQPVPPPDELAAAKVRELEAMSETFRNTTFLIAIRDSGFICNELLRVYGGIDASAKWMATCSEMHAYTVGVASTGTLHVEPTLQYFDGQWPIQPIQSIDDSTLVLPPQPRLPPQPQR
jgi:hypothetical protein